MATRQMMIVLLFAALVGCRFEIEQQSAMSTSTVKRAETKVFRNIDVSAIYAQMKTKFTDIKSSSKQSKTEPGGDGWISVDNMIFQRFNITGSTKGEANALMPAVKEAFKAEISKYGGNVVAADAWTLDEEGAELPKWLGLDLEDVEKEKSVLNLLTYKSGEHTGKLYVVLAKPKTSPDRESWALWAVIVEDKPKE